MFGKCNIFLIGPMGAGKSTIGRQLASQLNMDFFDSDREIELRAGADISWVFDVEGELAFRVREERVVGELTQKRGIVLATGGGSVLSSVTRHYLSCRGLVIYLETTIERQILRTQRDKRRPLLTEVSSKSLTDIRAVLEGLAKERNPFYKEISDFQLSTDDQSIRVIVGKILNFLKNNNFFDSLISC